MSDSLSSENLGKAFFLAHALKVYGSKKEEAINEWCNEYRDVDRTEWANAANEFCRYLKQAEADS